MEKNKGIIILLIMILFLLLMVGCGYSEEEADQTGEGSSSVTHVAEMIDDSKESENCETQTEGAFYQRGLVFFSGPYGTEMFNNSKEPGTCVSTSKATYYFSVDLSKDEMSEYVKQTEKIIKEMESFGEVRDRKYDIYVANVNYNAAVEENTLFTTYLNFGKIEHIQEIAQLIFGNGTNYGLLYGYAASFEEEYGFDVVAGSLTEAFRLRETNPEYFDLNYACFLSDYVDKDDIESLKIIAANYYQYLDKHGKNDVVKKYSDAKHREYFNEFLIANGIEAYDNSDIDGIAVYSGGNAVRLIWENKYSKFYLEKDFQTNRIEECFESDMLNSGYHNLRRIMVDYKHQAEWVVKELSAYDFEMYQGKVVFTSHSQEYKQMCGGVCRWEWGCKTPDDGSIELYMCSAYLHEYVHLLVGPQSVEKWLKEALAYYYSYLKRDTELNYEYADEKAAYDKGLLDSTKQLLVTYMGRQLDLREEDDWLFYLNACNVMFDRFDRVNDELGGGVQKFLFVTYLTELVGEKNAVEALISGEAESILGKSWDELQSEWKEKSSEEFLWVMNQ